MLRETKYQLIVTMMIVTALSGYRCQQAERDSDIPFYTNWVITDSIIEWAVEEEILHHPEVPSHLIDVEVVNGIARLSGSTDNILARERAAEIAGAIKGVKGVVNNLQVKCVSVSDEEIHSMIETALYQDPITDSYEYEIKVDNGSVRLYGIVDSWPEVEHAGDVARSIRGVCAVENNVNFVYRGGPRRDLEILADISQILHNDLYVDNDLIDVEVISGTVRLSGTVGSVSERNRAVTKSYVPGVDTVIAEDLEIAYWSRNPRLREHKYEERTDEEIRKAVITSFLIDPRLLGFDFTVTVNDGDVRLDGIVDNLVAKNVASENAENIIGVNHVVNRIKVRPEEIPYNKVLKEKIEMALAFHPYLAKYDLDISVSNGKVFLDGKVKTRYEKKLLSEVVSKVAGIIEIQNDTEVPDYPAYPHFYSYDPKIEPRTTGFGIKSDERIKKDIESELWWSPFVNEDDVNVSVHEGNAILTGIVDTPLEKRYAEINAHEGGAITIENRLVVD